MHDGYTPSSNNISIPKDEYQSLLRIKTKYRDLLAAIKNLQRFKVGYVDRHSSPSMLPNENGEYIRLSDLSDLTLTDEEISRRNKIKKIDEEINRLNAEREKLSNGK